MQEPAGTISQNGSNHDQLYPLGMDWAITLPVSCHAALLALPVMHAKTLMNPAPSPSRQDRLEKICAQGKLWQNRGSQAEEDHPQMKGTGGDNPCEHGKWRKRKTDDSLRIKREQLPQMVRPFCVPLKLFLKRRQAVRLMYYFTWTWYQQILFLDRISLQHRAPRDCGRGRRQQHNFAPRFLKIQEIQAGLSNWKVHLWAKTATSPFIRARSLWMPVWKCRWDWFHIKSLLLARNPRLPYPS